MFLWIHIIFYFISIKTQVDFDSVLNDTEHVRSVKVTNISPLDVYYTWSFTHHLISFEGKDEDEGMFWTFYKLDCHWAICMVLPSYSFLDLILSIVDQIQKVKFLSEILINYPPLFNCYFFKFNRYFNSSLS